MTRHIARRISTAACGLLLSGSAAAQNFSALVSPPRFEDTAKAGSTYRNVVEINNVSAQRAHFSLKTADWQLDAENSAVFSDALAPGSCRPWVGIEAPEISVPANGKRRYRFEVAVPADAASGECRFAIMLEGDPETVKGAVAMPVSARIGIIVYLGIGDATARLNVTGTRTQVVQGRRLPMLDVRNSGNAHGRLDGFIDGRDASGRKFTFIPSNLPILPGEARVVLLTPQGDNDKTPAADIAYPLVLNGRLDAGAQRIDIATTVSQ